MNQDDIIRMAREAGGHEGDQCESCGETHTLWMFGYEELEHFAAIVAAAEREACIDVLMRLHESHEQAHNYYHYAANQIREMRKDKNT